MTAPYSVVKDHQDWTPARGVATGTYESSSKRDTHKGRRYWYYESSSKLAQMRVPVLYYIQKIFCFTRSWQSAPQTVVDVLMNIAGGEAAN
jgi:hypothetical protein